MVTYDQLGCGASDKPTDPSLWRIGRYVEEVETVRRRSRIEVFKNSSHMPFYEEPEAYFAALTGFLAEHR